MSQGFVITFVVGSMVLRSQIQSALQGSRFVVEGLKQGGPLIFGGYGARQPSLAIVEAGVSSVGLFPLITAIRHRSPNIRVVLAGDFRHPNWLRELPAWADGLVQGDARSEVLFALLELVMLGGAALPTPLTTLFIEQVRTTAASGHGQDLKLDDQPCEDLPIRPLSAQEKTVLDCLKDGGPNKVIAKRLDLTMVAVNTAIKSIIRKVGVRNRTQAALWALKNLPDEGARD